MQENGNETIFTVEATPLKYGPGAAEEAGWEVHVAASERSDARSRAYASCDASTASANDTSASYRSFSRAIAPSDSRRETARTVSEQVSQ